VISDPNQINQIIDDIDLDAAEDNCYSNTNNQYDKDKIDSLSQNIQNKINQLINDDTVNFKKVDKINHNNSQLDNSKFVKGNFYKINN